MRIVQDRLEMVGLGHALDLFPNELSGGMRKRAGLGPRPGHGPGRSCSATSLPPGWTLCSRRSWTSSCWR